MTDTRRVLTGAEEFGIMPSVKVTLGRPQD
jgi:hypothetical protein